MKYILSDVLTENDLIGSIEIAKKRVDQQLSDAKTDTKASFSYAQIKKPRPYATRFDDAFIGVVAELFVAKRLNIVYEPQYRQYKSFNAEPDAKADTTRLEIRGTRDETHVIIRPQRDFNYRYANETLLCQVTNIKDIIILPNNFSENSELHSIKLNPL